MTIKKLILATVKTEINDMEVMANWYASEVFGSTDVNKVVFVYDNGDICAKINNTPVLLRVEDFVNNIPDCINVSYLKNGNFKVIRIGLDGD